MPNKLKAAEAIARIEGFGKNPLNRATRNNNPGDIEWGDFAIAHGATRVEKPPPHVTPRFAYFPTPSLGMEALTALLKIHYHGYSPTSLLMHYAPPSENNTAHYIDMFCNMTGCGPNEAIDAYL